MARVAVTTAEKLDWLQLCRSGGVGPQDLLQAAATASAARAGRSTSCRGSPARPAARTAGAAAGATRPRTSSRRSLDLGCALVAQGEPGYPRRLAEIADPPPLLIVRGRVELLEQPAIAVVGARNASANGRMLAHSLASELAAAGLLVISGLARGIDTAAHEGALAAGAPTVAVIASGVDVAYPSENAELMERIAASGAIVSERPLGAVPQARHFPRRNRLISGLSLGVVVVEAAPQSGSLITARLAAEQGREVMAVPGSPLDPRHRGTNQLLRDGATLVESAADVLAALGPLAPRRVSDPRARPARPAQASEPRRAGAAAAGAGGGRRRRHRPGVRAARPGAAPGRRADPAVPGEHRRGAAGADGARARRPARAPPRQPGVAGDRLNSAAPRPW